MTTWFHVETPLSFRRWTCLLQDAGETSPTVHLYTCTAAIHTGPAHLSPLFLGETLGAVLQLGIPPDKTSHGLT